MKLHKSRIGYKLLLACLGCHKHSSDILSRKYLSQFWILRHLGSRGWLFKFLVRDFAAHMMSPCTISPCVSFLTWGAVPQWASFNFPSISSYSLQPHFPMLSRCRWWLQQIGSGRIQHLVLNKPFCLSFLFHLQQLIHSPPPSLYHSEVTDILSVPQWLGDDSTMRVWDPSHSWFR